MKKYLVIIITALFAIPIFAQVHDVPAEVMKNYDIKYGMGIGVESLATTANRINTISFVADLTDSIKIGGNFGFIDTFNQLLLGPKVKYLFFKHKHVNVFSQAGIYYREALAAGRGISCNLTGGVEFFIPEVEEVGISIAYGLVADFFGQNDFEFINSYPFGNFAIHYYF
ncbi:MAG: hypothetical protein ABIA04_14180 [Pseudomonadota bacterium]